MSEAKMTVGFARLGKGEALDISFPYDEVLVLTKGSYTVRTEDGEDVTVRAAAAHDHERNAGYHRDLDLRTTAGAEAQGPNRYERAAHALAAARRADSRTSWRLVDVRGVGHDWAAMAVAAQSVLA